ncbi:MAG TPA: dienelactone hydrolase family protein [Vicinamibacteria bacterium]|nr:dienelactone hydrolase family protein [Vicinamibacteria bacterium]
MSPLDLMIEQREVSLPVGASSVQGALVVPAEASGIVLFAHGSGSSRHSPRNRRVAADLVERGLGTLLLDLLTPEEEAVDARTSELRFDIPFLADRLVAATDWVLGEPRLGDLPLGFFGASTGAAAALVAADRRSRATRAVVSRGGRPDLAGTSLTGVQAPTLFIVGGNDPQVLRLNEDAMRLVPAETRLEVIPGATHLFEEPGAMDEVERLAGDWFKTYLR